MSDFLFESTSCTRVLFWTCFTFTNHSRYGKTYLPHVSWWNHVTVLMLLSCAFCPCFSFSVISTFLPEFVMAMIDTFRNQKLIHRKFVYQMLIDLKKMFVDTPSLMRISLPSAAGGNVPKFSVCGDTHGQVSMLRKLPFPLSLSLTSSPYSFPLPSTA